ncbi:Uma2 family endonuclease [Baaleninema simplex]|uniref:Uma2 family endonuclease n=1 Tax=Baaleninema simplex TaxID=2862350 RepID=UPI00034852C5|nr:Uma2 family endonuclease [Baaleninema simplex]
MTVTIPKKYSFEEYRSHPENRDIKCEFVNGDLVEMPPASGLHADILDFLQDIFKQEIQKTHRDWFVRPGTIGVRTGVQKSRIPDLVIITNAQRQALRNLPSAILEEPPRLVVEIVSPGNPEEDYRYKRSEYAALQIPEYWIVDAIASKITVLEWVEGLYEPREFQGSEKLESPTFEGLDLTSDRIFSQ